MKPYVAFMMLGLQWLTIYHVLPQGHDPTWFKIAAGFFAAAHFLATILFALIPEKEAQ